MLLGKKNIFHFFVLKLRKRVKERESMSSIVLCHETQINYINSNLKIEKTREIIFSFFGLFCWAPIFFPQNKVVQLNYPTSPVAFDREPMNR